MAEEENKQKATKGRQKIAIRKIENKSHRQVTFSKRRNGLVMKASEVSLSGAHVAVIAFSPGGKVFSFGYPDTDSVVRRYMGEESWELQDCPVSGSSVFHTHQQLREEHEELLNRFQVEKMHTAKPMEEQVKRGQNGGGFWWEEERVEDMGLEELGAFVKAVEKLRENVIGKVNMD
ncbi:unnamed protein product [Linum tenue]|uniref:MADS-box domain-containing protein n=1 Tax=Linum tenue TaxID=586396 RepID=A0AAV0NLL3_9ROSI|nr:unnamed protein product [Linum tenue]